MNITEKSLEIFIVDLFLPWLDGRGHVTKSFKHVISIFGVKTD